jgi:hypothetical protein
LIDESTLTSDVAEFGVTASRTNASMQIRQTPNFENMFIASLAIRIGSLLGQ